MDEDAVNEQVPDWNADMDAEWERQMKNAMPEGPSAGAAVAVLERESITLNQALGLPEDLKDLWPGHCYLPPTLEQIDRLTSLANSVSEKWNAGDILASADDAVELILTVAHKVDGENVVPVTKDDIRKEFRLDELGPLCHHIMRQEGLEVQGVRGNSPSGRPIGVKSFHWSAASMDTTSSDAESSPTSS